MTDLSAGPGVWGPKANEPDTSGQYPDPEAIRQKRIAELEREMAWCDKAMSFSAPGTVIYDDAWNRKMVLRAELSRLGKPKGGDAIDREAEAAAARHEANKGKPWPTERLINDLVAAGESEYAPSPSPEPQDAREALNRAIRSVEALYLCGYTGNILLDNLYIVQAALAQSDAQPVGWLFSLAKYRDSVTGEYVDWGPDQFSFTKPHVPEGSIRNLRPLYTAPPRPDAAGLTEAAEWHEQRRRDTPDVFEGEFHEVCAEYFRSRAADRSAPRSDKGEA